MDKIKYHYRDGHFWARQSMDWAFKNSVTTEQPLGEETRKAMMTGYRVIGFSEAVPMDKANADDIYLADSNGVPKMCEGNCGGQHPARTMVKSPVAKKKKEFALCHECWVNMENPQFGLYKELQ